jgi:hypothetical protein
LVGLVFIVGFSLVLGSCREGNRDPGLMVTDSAGVEIVEHPPSTEIPTWELKGEPLVQIGVALGDSLYEFGSVTGVVWEDDGRILVLDRSRRRISLFGPEGEYIVSSGREGEGPGEYRSPSAVWEISGDSLAVYDPPLGRVSVLDWNASFVRSVQVRPIRTLVLPSGSFEDGRLFVVNAFPDPQDYGLATSYTVSTEGRDSLGEFRHIENQDPGPLSAVRRPLVAKVRRLWAAGQKLYVIRNVDYELQIQNPDGELLRIVRWHGRDLTATRESNRHYIEERVARSPPDRVARRRRGLEERIPNERYPPFERIRVDRRGRAWLQAYRQPFDAGLTAWTVADASGQLVGRMDLPEDAVVLDATDESVLLRLTDDLGVESLAVYDLDRGERR